MRLALIESPFMFRADDAESRRIGLLRNVTYARLAMRDAFLDGFAPYASHLFFTQPLVLDDDRAEERQIGIDAGLAWGAMAEVTFLYEDLGLSSGMRYGIENANRASRPVVRRNLFGWERAIFEAPAETLKRLGLYDDAALDAVAASGGVFGPVPVDLGFSAARTP